jgi:hypothetical protein
MKQVSDSFDLFQKLSYPNVNEEPSYGTHM